LLLVVGVAIMAATAACSRETRTAVPEPGDAAADSSAVLALEEGWAAAVVRRDSAFFQRTLAPGFIYSEDDRTITREQLLRDLITGSDTVEAAHNEEMTFHRFGPTTIVTGWLVMRGRGQQGPFDRRYRFTDVWVKRDGTWQIVAAHDYLKPEKRP
jgi:hypothetical protein